MNAKLTLLFSMLTISPVTAAELDDTASPKSETSSVASEPSAAHLEFFEAKVRPLLVENCFQCHSATAKKVQAGLYLDSHHGTLKGGDSGPSVVPGDPDASPLIKAVRYEDYEMPPDRKLSQSEIDDLTRWVKLGAFWPKSERPSTPADVETNYDWQKLRESHWAWRPIVRPAVPRVSISVEVKDTESAEANAAESGATRLRPWSNNEIDRFVGRRLVEKGLSISPPATRRVLVRRAYLSLLGLPPSSAAVESFVNDLQPGAFARLLDELMASPHYGERWGRHWLDVARYSDGFGGFNDGGALPHAFHYRDWVVRSLNADLPYDQFVRQQIAGDLIDEGESFLGTGFLAVGPTYRSDGGDPKSVAQAKSETLDDRVDTVSRAFLAVTVACARCHDHKFDPVPTLDYYSLAGIFNNTRTIDRPLAPPDEVERFNQSQAAVKKLQNELKKAERAINMATKTEKRERTDDETKKLESMRQRLEELKRDVPPKYAVAYCAQDSGSKDMNVALRGDLRKPGPVAPRRFLQLLSADPSHAFSQGSGRLELADAIVSPDNPLTARVIVNRVWQKLMGKGLVSSASNFGALGNEPSHPELLDWLADEFVRSKWSIKSLQRRIMLSATYQMSSQYDAKSFAIDGDNEFYWRTSPRRMDVETWRDTLLTVTGELDRRFYGKAVDHIFRGNRRTLYAKISRSGDHFESDDLLRLFDFPAPRASSASRTVSVVPQQFLFMMNSSFMVDRAKALAARLAREAEDDEERIRLAYRTLYGRSPHDPESALALRFLSTKADDENKLTPWERYAQILLSSNELMHID